ncbi:MAG: GIY-YIG nuclease family protein [Bacteroidetes bacterium]|nr:GIY-YIG nuclease family protein [Bacteroidota bacterium]
MRTSYVYILTNRHRSVFYIGVTANLMKRMQYHQAGTGSKFCSRYNVNILIYYETFSDIRDAIHRETCLKRWNRDWKLELIRKKNPEMRDLLEKGKR